MSPSGESPLEQLAAKSGRDFPNLLEARRRTASGLEERRARLAELTHDSDVSIVLMGSWGRAEVTAGSDDDFMVLVDGPQREETQPPIEAVKNVLDRAPGNQGIFGEPVSCDRLVEDVGLDRDDNTNLTRRMLFLLESVAATAGDSYSAARRRVLRPYRDESGDDDFRRELGEVTRAGAEKSAAYEQTRTLGRNLEAGLLALLFETSSLPKLVRDYAIF